MRVIITSDLHYNHARSRSLVPPLAEQINRIEADALLVIGDTAAFDGPAIEECLSLLTFAGPKLFVAGNHELWTAGEDSHRLYTQDLPQRVRRIGWQWLEDEPFVVGDVGIVGSVGWYDYSFARAELGIPRRFYEHKISPGAASRFDELAPLLNPSNDISSVGKEVVARWNDGRWVKLRRSDEQFLEELLDKLRRQLDSLRSVAHVVAAIHHLPFPELLPPPHGAQWDFAKAFLGSERIGQLLLEYRNVEHVTCGHSHYAAEARVGHIRAFSTGCGYRSKNYQVIEVGR
jgi:Icc-related predicted phosphoesterase